MLVVLNVAVAGEACGLVLMRTSGRAWAGLWYASALGLSAAVVALVANWRIFSRSEEPDRSLKFLRAAYVWLLVSLAMLVGLPAYLAGLPLLSPASSAAAMGFSHAYYGAVRHAITVGFVSLMIVGVAAKVVPTLNGIDSHRLSSLWAPFLLINLGCALRVFGQTATDFTAGAFPVAGLSGLLEVTGLALWGGHLWRVMSGRPRLRPERDAMAEPLTDSTPIGPKHTVGAVLEGHPELLDVFVSFGFTMLANPQLRRTIARVITIERACRRTGADLPHLLDSLNIKREQLQCRASTAGSPASEVGPISSGTCQTGPAGSRIIVALSNHPSH
jgi:hypothetical protein